MTRFALLVLWLVLPSILEAQDSSRAACDSAATASNVRRCFEHALQTAERDLQRYVDEARRRAADRALLEDRKSTRLNSSHSQISYAVFCLKKKKNSSE